MRSVCLCTVRGLTPQLRRDRRGRLPAHHRLQHLGLARGQPERRPAASSGAPREPRSNMNTVAPPLRRQPAHHQRAAAVDRHHRVRGRGRVAQRLRERGRSALAVDELQRRAARLRWRTRSGRCASVTTIASPMSSSPASTASSTSCMPLAQRGVGVRLDQVRAGEVEQPPLRVGEVVGVGEHEPDQQPRRRGQRDRELVLDAERHEHLVVELELAERVHRRSRPRAGTRAGRGWPGGAARAGSGARSGPSCARIRCGGSGVTIVTSGVPSAPISL